MRSSRAAVAVGEPLVEGQQLSRAVPAREAEQLGEVAEAAACAGGTGRVALYAGRAAAGPDEAAGDLDERGLAGTVRAEQADELSLLNLEVDALEGFDAAVPLLQTVNREGGRCGGRHAASVRSTLRARSGSKKAQTCDGFRDMLAVGRRLVAPDAAARSDIDVTYPKIELHVHLEGTVRPATLLEIAHRNDYALPVSTEAELTALYDFRDFNHFIEIWVLTTNALRRDEDFRQVVVDYAREAAAHGAVYIEGIFSPAERARRGVDWDEIFTGYCDGADEARELHGVEIRLTPDIIRGFTLDEALTTVRFAAKYRDRGVLGVGLGGMEAEYPPEPYEPAFTLARDLGLASVPHAGEVAGPSSVRGALEALGADRLRHGIRAAEDPGLLREIASRRIVLDVCPISNLRTRAVLSLEEHPLPQLVAAGAVCSISTDDPAMFGTDLTGDYDAAVSLGLDPKQIFAAGLEGALCDESCYARLRMVGDEYDWEALP